MKFNDRLAATEAVGGYEGFHDAADGGEQRGAVVVSDVGHGIEYSVENVRFHQMIYFLKA